MASSGHAVSDSSVGHPALGSAHGPDPVWGREAGRLPLPRGALKRRCRVRPQPQWPGQGVEPVCCPVNTGPSAPLAPVSPCDEAWVGVPRPLLPYQPHTGRTGHHTLLLTELTRRLLTPDQGPRTTLHQGDESAAAGPGASMLLLPPKDYRVQPG